MSHAPDGTKEARRLDVLRSTGVLDSTPEKCFDMLARCAALLTACPMALISLSDVERQWFKSAVGIGASEIPRQNSFCDLAVRLDQPLEVPDALADPYFAANALVTGVPHVRFYAGVPLDLDGVALGTLCVLDTMPRALTGVQHDALHALGQAVCELLRVRQQALRLDHERQRLLDFARASGEWMWETDASLRYTWVSDSFEAITGEPGSALLGSQVADAPQLDAFGQEPPQAAMLFDLLRAGRPFVQVVTEERNIRGRRLVSRSAVPVFGAHGEPTGWRGTTRDVTEPVEMAQRERSQDEVILQLTAQVPGVIYQYRRDAHGRARYEFVNERAIELFGVSRDALMADASLFYATLHPEDRERVRQISQLREGGGARLPQVEYRVVRPDGSERWMSSTSAAEINADGSVVWRGFVADITESKRMALALQASEERWAMAADAAGIGIVRIDLDRAQIHFDPRAAAHHGLAVPTPNCSLDAWFERVHPDDREAAGAALQHALERGSHFETRHRFVRADGRQPWLELSARVERADSGSPKSLIGTCRDVTEQMAVETLRLDRDNAERASRAKSEFLSRVSHELRTPLNGILGFAQLMALDRQQPLGDEQRRRLDGVQRSGRHLLALIDDVLDIARIEQRAFQPQLQPVNLIRSLHACLVMMQPLVAGNGVDIGGDVPDACWVLADERALEQVLMNLLSNAVKFNRPGGRVRLGIETHVGPQGDSVAFSVEDDGPGLSAEQQKQLFQPFNRLGAERRRIEGTGLGLVIVRDLTLAMRGHLSVGSAALGTGCRFTLELAASAAPDDVAATAPAAFDEAAGPAPHRQILYIEDEALNIVLMEEVFRQQLGWTLHTARDGAEGLELARSLLPDLLLVDINLPDMNGIALIRELRGDAATAGLHCIALSADAMHEQVATARAAGFDDYWTKPINVTHLMQTLAGTLARGRPGA